LDLGDEGISQADCPHGGQPEKSSFADDLEMDVIDVLHHLDPLVRLHRECGVVSSDLRKPSRQEKLYEYTMSVTGMVEYGASFRDIMGGLSPPPPGGLRVDVAFEGPMTGA